MIDGLYSALTNYQGTPQQQQTNAAPHKVLRMVKNERMGGFVPMWETISAAPAKEIETALGNALNQTNPETAQTALSYQAPNAQGTPNTSQSESFGFGDLIDMINPLQHIPIVSQLYRNFTGDTIRPIGQIIGGALYGGPLGAASGLINTVIQEETGKDLGDNAIALMLSGETPKLKSSTNEPPAARLAEITQSIKSETAAHEASDLGNLLSFVDMKAKPTGITIQRV